MRFLKIAIQIAIMLLPWSMRRWFLVKCMGYDIHPTARVGKSIILSRKLIMAEYSRIGDLTFASGLEEIRLDRHSRIGKLNWISGFPLGPSRYFRDFPARYPLLHVGEHASIVNRNLIDCTDRVIIGKFSLLAGNRGQILTHGIDIRTSNQSCAPVKIGDYCMVGTACVVLKGASLPSYCILGAGSVLQKHYAEGFRLYSGVPAVSVKILAEDISFFRRSKGTSD
ncbi:acyltransferase (plasmid) [Novosphingobium sp. P6W]|nr:acyltransferase [Novosphingobium sp. P6W]